MSTITATISAIGAAQQSRAQREVRLFASPWTRYGAIAAVVAVVVFPLTVGDLFTLSLLTTIGIFSIGAIGLNVVNGYAGHVSLGQPLFLAIGAFTAVFLGVKLDLPLPVWIVGSAVTAGLVGVAAAPLALRLRGLYQIVLGLGLVAIGHFVFVNWKPLTGGNNGTSANMNMSIGFLDMGSMQIGGMLYKYEQGLFIVTWLLVAVCMLLVHHLMSSSAGRRMVSLRDNDLAARVVGVRSTRVLLGAYAISTAMGGVAGALYVAQSRYAAITPFNIDMALQFMIIITIGGLASAWGPVVGSAVVIAIPLLAGKYAAYMPFLTADSAVPDGTFGIPAGQFAVVVYGVVLLVLLRFEPKGITDLVAKGWARIRR